MIMLVRLWKSVKISVGILLIWNTWMKTRVSIIYEIPLSEIVYDFFDQLKSSTKGYASFDYELIGYKTFKTCENGYFIKC